MKKIVIAAAILMCSSMAIMSCDNGAYDADPNTNNGSVPITNVPGGGGSGGGSSSFNWTGTDPFSAKVDGTPFQGTSATAGDISGFTMIIGGNTAGDFQIVIPTGAAPNSTYNFSGTAYANYIVGFSDTYIANTSTGGSGGVKILENDATHVKGYFYGVFKSTTGATTKTVTEGYFNATK